MPFHLTFYSSECMVDSRQSTALAREVMSGNRYGSEADTESIKTLHCMLDGRYNRASSGSGLSRDLWLS